MTNNQQLSFTSLGEVVGYINQGYQAHQLQKTEKMESTFKNLVVTCKASC